MTPAPTLVSVAGNLDPADHLPAAVARLHDQYGVAARSRFWITPALDRPQQPDYWNGVVRLERDEEPERLRENLRAIEAELGRTRGPDAWAARTVDLDPLRCRSWHDPEVLERPWLVRAILDVDPLAHWPGHGPLATHPWSTWSAPEAPWPGSRT